MADKTSYVLVILGGGCMTHSMYTEHQQDAEQQDAEQQAERFLTDKNRESGAFYKYDESQNDPLVFLKRISAPAKK